MADKFKIHLETTRLRKYQSANGPVENFNDLIPLEAQASEVDPRYGGFLNADMAEYVVPVNADIGSIETDFIDEPDPLVNNVGVKGLGEVVMAGVAPAIANAIFHATGKRVRDLPIRYEHLL